VDGLRAFRLVALGEHSERNREQRGEDERDERITAWHMIFLRLGVADLTEAIYLRRRLAKVNRRAQRVVAIGAVRRYG
jgi:hypothetical protein